VRLLDEKAEAGQADRLFHVISPRSGVSGNRKTTSVL
jgi:hypothetical protein